MNLYFAIVGLLAGAAVGVSAGLLLVIPFAESLRDPRWVVLATSVAFAFIGSALGWAYAARRLR